MKKTVNFIIFSILIVLLAWIGKEGYRSAKMYEQNSFAISHMLKPENLAKMKLESFADTLTFGLYESKSTKSLKLLQTKQKNLKKEANKIAAAFGIVAGLILIFSFMVSARFGTVVLSVGALIALINGLVTPVLMVTVHKEIEYFGDMILSFESKGILESLMSLYKNGDSVVAVVIMLFSVVLPLLKILSLLFVAIYEHRAFASKIVHFFKAIGKWSMADVFVVSMLLVYLSNSNSDISKAEIEVGLYFFLVYVILSMFASIRADRMLKYIE